MCAQDGDLQGEARASFESARAELMSLENGTREPTQTAWESARQTAQAEVGVVVCCGVLWCGRSMTQLYKLYKTFSSERPSLI